ncbi:MAG: hypothetical protein ACJ8AW_35200 [Rhodopila sp.]|jgi:hypothetical protein
MTEHLRTIDMPLGDGARALTAGEFALIARGLGLSLGNGFSWSGYRDAVLAKLMREPRP